MYYPDMKMRPALFILPFLVLLTACIGGQKPAPVSNFGQSPGAGSSGVHNVVEGDTVYSLSRRYNIAMQDIIIENRLAAPFKLYTGQRVNLPPPQEYRVRPGDSLYTVSRLFGVNSSEIARQNRISAPYTLRVGQVLRLPSASRGTPDIMPAAGSQVYASSSAPVLPVKRQDLSAPSNSSSQASLGSGVINPPSVPSAKKGEAGKTSISKSSLSSVPTRSGKGFMRPVSGPIVSAFGPKKSGLHNDGINIKASRGSPVRAAENGVVAYAGSQLKGSGNLVLLRHQGQWMTAYAHMDKIMVKRGSVVKKGETIGTVGSTGSVSSPQLHFEVRRGTEALNPVKYVSQ